MSLTEGTIYHAPEELVGRVYRQVLEASGNPHLHRGNRMPYNQAARVGANILYFGIDRSNRNYHVEDQPAQDMALLPDQLEDLALLRSLQALSGYKATHDFCRVIVQSGLLETDGVTF